MRALPAIDCHIAYTNPGTHELIRSALDRSPLFSGQIEVAVRATARSIEDKIVRFAERERQLFLEPEGLNTHRVYVNGLSTSLPADVQLAMVRSIAGLEQAEILQHGYAVEYDFAGLATSTTVFSTRGSQGCSSRARSTGRADMKRPPHRVWSPVSRRVAESRWSSGAIRPTRACSSTIW